MECGDPGSASTPVMDLADGQRGRQIHDRDSAGSEDEWMDRNPTVSVKTKILVKFSV